MHEIKIDSWSHALLINAGDSITTRFLKSTYNTFLKLWNDFELLIT